MIRHVAKAFAVVLFALIAIKVAATFVAGAIGPIVALLALVLVVMWFVSRRNFHL